MIDDAQLADQIRQVLGDQPSMIEKTMFGGTVFMVNGHIVCGLVGDELLVRVGAERYATALEQQHVRPFQMGRRTSKGWVLVATQALDSTSALEKWVQQGLATVSSLPAK